MHNKHGETALLKKKPTMKKYCFILAVAALFAACVGGQNNSSNAVKDFARAKVTEYYNCDADKVDVEKCNYSFESPIVFSWCKAGIAQAQADYAEGKMDKNAYREKVDELLERCDKCCNSWMFGETLEEYRAAEERTMYKCTATCTNGNAVNFFILCDKDETPLYTTMDVMLELQQVTAIVQNFTM